MVGLRTREGKPFPVVAPRSYVVDLPAGAVRVGGVDVDELTPLLPPEDNTVPLVYGDREAGRRGGHRHRHGPPPAAHRHRSRVLNDFWGGKVDVGAVTALEARGFRTTGASPTLFWFGYPSRTLSLDAAARELAEYVRTPCCRRPTQRASTWSRSALVVSSRGGTWRLYPGGTASSTGSS